MDAVRVSIFLGLALAGAVFFVLSAWKVMELFAMRMSAGQRLFPRRPFALHPEVYDDASATPPESPEERDEFAHTRRRVFSFTALAGLSWLLGTAFFEITGM